MKPVNVKSSKYIDINEESNKEDPQFKIDDLARISKCKNIFAEGYTPNWSEEVFIIKKVKNTVLWTFDTSELNSEEIVGTFYEKNFKKQMKKSLELKK